MSARTVLTSPLSPALTVCAAPEQAFDASTVATPVDAMLLDVAFADVRVGVAVGGTTERGPSVGLRTDDGGPVWEPVATSAQGRLYAVAWSSESRAPAAARSAPRVESNTSVTRGPCGGGATVTSSQHVCAMG